MKTFTLDYWKDGDLFVGRLREVPGVLSQGTSVDHLKKSIADAFKLFHDAEASTVPARKFQSTEVTI
jgi:predicted RNase H-like HicB family nuclease